MQTLALGRSGGDPVSATASPSTGRNVAAALIVFAACLVGARVGTAMRFPGVGTAILFPPYAVLTAALLRSPTRRWWIFLLASAAGNLGPHLVAGSPLSFVLMAEVANTTRALVAAGGVRRSGACASGVFASLRGMAIFLFFAVFLAPLVSAFMGAGVVALHGGAYWLPFRAWLLSNVLTGLTLLPITLVRPRSMRIFPGRIAEAALLFVALALVAGFVFLSPDGADALAPAALYVPLPLLLWASVRFGPLGTSSSLLLVSGLAIAGALMGRGLLVGHSAAANLLDLQAFLLAVSVPLLLLSALLREQRTTAEALRRSQRQYQMVVEDQTEMICRFLPSGLITFVNDAFCQATLRTSDDLLGKTFESLMPEEQRAKLHERLASLGPGRPLVTWEQERFDGDGGRSWEQWRVRALFDDAGKLVDHQAVGRDITDRKRAQEEHVLLEAQRTRTEVLQEADRRKDEFIAILAHELRNPLAPIAMVVELLRRRPVADEQIIWAQEVVGRQVGQLKRLVDDLLDVSRVERGTIQLRLEVVDLTRVVATAVETSRPLLTDRKLDLAIDLPASPLEVRGDAARLAQLISNLLNNAAKYTPPGGRVRLAVARTGSAVLVRIRDSGVGIPPQMLERVFEPFTQVDRRRDGALGGLGLGLTLVKRLVELHGGRVEAHSEGPGLGSEFVVELPVHAGDGLEPASGPLKAAAEERPFVGARRILVVDDGRDAAESLARFLRLQGYAVKVFNDGKEGLEAAERTAPDVVFLDLGMPGLDGLEVARGLRRRFGPDRMLLVATTGYGQPQDVQRTSQAGFDHHLTKPIDVQAVLAILRSLEPPRGESATS